MARRKVSSDQGLYAYEATLTTIDTTSSPRSQALARRQMITAVRYTLEELAQRYPGQSVEVRVPPAGAVQILQGTTHRRGTPPAVIETDMTTWMCLVSGRMTWNDAVESGAVQASGNRADLSTILPLASLTTTVNS